MPELEGMSEDQLTSLRETAIWAYAKAKAEWNQKTKDEKEEAQRQQEEADRIQKEKEARERQERENEGKGSGFVTFLVILIIVGILAGLAYFLHKYNKSRGKNETLAYDTLAQDGIDADGVAVQKKGDRVLPTAPAHDVEAGTEKESLKTPQPPSPPPSAKVDEQAQEGNSTEYLLRKEEV